MKKHHKHAMEASHASHKKVHHSDPIVGGESESEGRVWGSGEYANMPKEVKMKEYPKPAAFGPDMLDDTQGHINKVQEQAHSQARRHLSNQH